ncbi:carbohydrate ABC transporter permease [bacterium]|nr:MAG: carbohydrate ABC transporter permease [bacterium]
MLIVTGALLFSFPFLWMLSTSLKSSQTVFDFPPSIIPPTFHWNNYPDVLKSFPFARGLTNTLSIVVGVEIGRLLSVPLAAYAFARFQFPLRGPLFIVVLATMMMPVQALLIPQYLIFRNFGWLDTYLPLTMPSLFAGGSLGAFSVFLLRQFFLSIPREYSEAAELDGCGFLRNYWHIILPMSKPALAVVAIFTFIQEWNDFFGPLIYLTSSDKFTLAVSFQAWSQVQASGPGYTPQPFNNIMAVAALITLVPIVLFFLTQRLFIRGVVMSGMKG